MSEKTDKIFKFTLKDRVILPGILPIKGTFTDLLLRKDVVKKVELSQEEIGKFNVRSEGASLRWDLPEKDFFEFTFTDPEKNYIKTSLEDLNKRKELNVEHVDLYAMFV